MAPFPPPLLTLGVNEGALKSARHLYDQMRLETWGSAKQTLKMTGNMLKLLKDGGYIGPEGPLLYALDRTGTMSSHDVALVIKYHTARMLTRAAAYDEDRLYDPARNNGFQDPGQAADAIVEILEKIDQLAPADNVRERTERAARKTEVMRQGARLMLERAHNPKRPDQAAEWFGRARAYARKIRDYSRKAAP